MNKGCAGDDECNRKSIGCRIGSIIINYRKIRNNQVFCDWRKDSEILRFLKLKYFRISYSNAITRSLSRFRPVTHAVTSSTATKRHRWMPRRQPSFKRSPWPLELRSYPASASKPLASSRASSAEARRGNLNRQRRPHPWPLNPINWRTRMAWDSWIVCAQEQYVLKEEMGNLRQGKQRWVKSTEEIQVRFSILRLHYDHFTIVLPFFSMVYFNSQVITTKKTSIHKSKNSKIQGLYQNLVKHFIITCFQDFFDKTQSDIKSVFSPMFYLPCPLNVTMVC